MTPPSVADWRALVDRELAGASFDEVLVYESTEGLKTQPLYVEATATYMASAEQRVQVCTRHTDAASIAEAIAGGADALWLVPGSAEAREPMRAAVAGFTGRVFVDSEDVVSALPYHDGGAEAADELALVLSAGVARLRAGVHAVVFRISVGRDTFSELCKLRALRVLWVKVLAAAGLETAVSIHAVCSSRTLTERDAPTNMLRTTTQLFAAMLGGADWVTPTAFDELGSASPLAMRTARNTALILRDESQLGRVVDPAGGSYYFESFTDALAREAWKRFGAIERDGGVQALEASGALATRLEAARLAFRRRVVTRKAPIVGVSEFAVAGEVTRDHRPGHRDAEPFETLRARAEAHPVDVALIPLGPADEHRARVAFATALFATGGVKIDEASLVACICGSDERYADEAVAQARALKAAGCRRVLVAGRPGALEASLREAGVDDFIYLGCDVIAVLTPIVGAS